MTKKILITGANGPVARPIAESLANDNEVWVLDGYCRPSVQAALQAKGIRTFRWNSDGGRLDGLPDDFTHVLNSAADCGDDDTDLNGVIGMDATWIARLFEHVRNVQSFLHISTGSVYARQSSDHLYSEEDPVGVVDVCLPVDSVTKIASERAVRAIASTFRVPSVVARLGLAYGPHGHGGLPILLYRQLLERKAVAIPNRGENLASLIHTDDLARQAPLLWDKATVPSLVVNWGGDAAVSIQDALTYIAVLTGLEARFASADVTRETYAFDPALRRSLVGDCEISWREGFRRTLEDHFPGSVRTAAFA